MAVGLGVSAVVKLDNNAGTLTAITAYINSAQFKRMCDALETTIFGSSGNARTYIAGLKNCMADLAGPWDPTIDEILNDAFATATTRTLEVSPQGTGSGAVKYTVEVICTDYPINLEVEALGELSASLQGTGAVTRGTH